MQVSHFPAAAANSLIDGYCDDFVSLAAVLSQTLEQVSMRGIDITGSQPALSRIENGMRGLAEAIHELLERLPNSTPPARTPPPATTKAPTPGTPQRSTPAPSGPPQSTAPLPSPAASPSPGPKPAPQHQRTPPTAPAAARPTPPPVPSAPPSRPLTPPPAPPEQAPPRARTSTPAPTATRPSVPPRPQADLSQPRPKQPASPAPRRAEPDPNPGALRGTNDSMPLLSVFQFLERTRKSGLLTVEMSGETIRFGISAGCVQSCVSSKPVAGERLGDLVVAAGLAEAATVEAAVRELTAAEAPRDGRALGDLLVERGLLTNGQLLEVLEAQARQRFRRACGTPSASYAFATGAPESNDGRMRLAPMELSHRASWDPER